MGLKGSCSFFEAYRLLWWVHKAALGGRRPDPVLELFMLLGGQGELACVGCPRAGSTASDCGCPGAVLAAALGVQIFSFGLKRERRNPRHLHTEFGP